MFRFYFMGLHCKWQKAIEKAIRTMFWIHTFYSEADVLVEPHLDARSVLKVAEDQVDGLHHHLLHLLRPFVRHCGWIGLKSAATGFTVPPCTRSSHKQIWPTCRQRQQEQTMAAPVARRRRRAAEVSPEHRLRHALPTYPNKLSDGFPF